MVGQYGGAVWWGSMMVFVDIVFWGEATEEWFGVGAGRLFAWIS